MPLPQPTPEPLLELIAQRIRVIGQPVRMRLLDRLRERPATVRELTDALGAAQQNVSQHLAILHQAGVVARHKDGTHVHYELVDPHVLEVIDAAAASLARQLDEVRKLIESRS